MVEDMSVAEQTHEIINLKQTLADAEMKLPEKFLVISIVDKFLKSWKNFGMTLKHQKGRLSLNDLMIAISIEEKHRNQTHKMSVEHHLRANLIVEKQKVNKVGHWAKLCPNKKAKTGQAAVNMVVGGASTSGETKGLSKYLWGDALNTACHILNIVPLKHNTSTPFELWKGIPSSVTLDDSLASTSIPEHVEKMTNVGVNPSSTNLTHEESDEPRRSKRARVVKDFESDFVTYNIEDNPITFKDDMASLETKQWKEAVKSEMDSIISNGTWKLVAKGFKQKEGIDYFDTYSSVARLTTIRVLIALASVYSLPIHQMDVKTAFLYGELEEEIYMDQHEGFVTRGNERKVCKLVKSLYGLKQAPKQWHEKFDKTILAFGFTINEND
ncbi:UNVERIFIED_CONTAM: Retrovirus-related Pol polyprotein from transposon TNT 1-94 [Sesamum radiatum]|uniref:Retrovirus-related Pol polyprotein from transposon TNT 1-94 n=1 Tax=Sesamum radiatum TaxID=300843 RepID=A0AAW2R376_SESRA